MLTRFALFVVAVLLPVALRAQAPAAPVTPAPAAVQVKLDTSEGAIVLLVDTAHAPVTAANFLRYVDAKRFDGIGFFRAMNLPWGAGLIQAGIRDARKLYPPIAHEPTTQTGLSHTAGAISMARLAPGTATADFTISVGDMTGLDANPKAGGDNQGFAVFGRVVSGMDVVKRILAMPTDPAKGEGVMKGQMLAMPVKIMTARRVP